MTKPQRITLMADWWPKACAAQGWDKDDREKRIEVLSQIVGRKLSSASDLDSKADVDAVKNHLLMLADDVAATVETDHPEIGRARRLRFTIREQVQCLAIYMNLDVGLPGYTGQQAAEEYLAELIRDKFQHGARANLLHLLTIADLTDERRATRKGDGTKSELDELIFTLARVLKQHRKDRGHSIHDMRTAAGLECNCAQCCKRRRSPKLIPDLCPAGGPPWDYDAPAADEPF